MKCDYTGEEIKNGQGKMLVLTSGKKLFFKDSKAEKNWKKSRKLEYAEKEKE